MATNYDFIIRKGNLGVGTASPTAEIDVNGSIATNSVIFKNSGGGNTLGYYEEDSWTPQIETVNNDIGAVNYVDYTGPYTRIGNTVHAWFNIDISSIGGIGTGTGKITGLPYAANTNIPQYSVTILNGSVLANGAAGEQIKGYITSGDDFITLYLYDSGTGGYGPSADAHWIAGGGIISGYVSYQV